MTASSIRQGVDIGAKRIADYVNDSYELILDAHHNSIECRASINVFNTRDSIAPAELIHILQNNKITDTVDLEQVAIFCSEAASGEDPQNVLLAKGKEAKNGVDGWFELVVNTGRDDAELEEDDQGRVDFKSIQAFSNVEPKQLIGVVYPPTQGTAGLTIYGEEIEPIPGRICEIIAGKGVSISSEGTTITAEQGGRVVFENKVISITEELVINGDVDLSIGHISFNGFVDIKGDVLDDFNISSTKGIKISGAVGNCQIISEGPVSVGSMAGAGQGKVSCYGSFNARYVNQVNIESLGDINIQSEARNSILKATGKINVAKGLITGGSAIALEGIEARIIGARTGTKTLLTSGVYFPEADRLIFLRTRIKSLAEQFKRINVTLTSLNSQNLADKRPALRDATLLRIGILTQRQVNLDEERDALMAELNAFTLTEHKSAAPVINVLDSLQEGVICSLGESYGEVTADIATPATIAENSDNGSFRYLSYTPLA